MAVNGTGTFHRTRHDEDEDVDNLSRNVLAESWRHWPNEAAVSVVPGTVPPCLCDSLILTNNQYSLTTSRNIAAPSP